MKFFLGNMAALLLFAAGLQAQNLPPDYNWEVGLNGGISGYTRPLGPAIGYQGTRTRLVSDYSVCLNYYLTPHWKLNLDIGSRKWVSYGDWQLNDQFGQQLKTRQITFLEAAHAINESVGINYVIPFYTRYTDYNKANVYFGAMVGMVTTVNDGSLGYSKYGSAPDSNYVYMSKYDYGYGVGLSYGVQMGITYYIIPRLGINLDLAARFASIHTQDQRYGSENKYFYLMYFPETLGVRWRF